jgi:hypothetical protein
MPFPFTQNEEDQILDDNDASEQRVITVSTTVTPNLADAVTDFYKTYPDLTPWVLSPTAKAYASGAMDEKYAKDFLEKVTLKAIQDRVKNYKPPKKKSWFERNVSDKAKGALRWAQGGLQFVPDVVTGAAGYAGTTIMSGIQQAFGQAVSTGEVDLTPTVIPKNPSLNPTTALGVGDVLGTGAQTVPEFTTGTGKPSEILWDQTLIGAMVQNPDLIGTGYFPSEEIYQIQGEAARQARGTIDGRAANPGRVLANVVAQPGSVEYNILSGLIDLGVALAVPSVPGGKALAQGAKVGAEAVLPLRTLAGLTRAESAMIIPSKVTDFLRSTAGRSVIERIVKIDSVDEAMEIFPTANAKFWQEVTDAKDTASVQNLLNDTLGLGDITRGIGPKSIDDVNISRWDTVKRDMPYFGTQSESKVARLIANMPGQHVVIAGGSDREVAKSITNVKNYLRAIKLDQGERTRLVDMLTRALNEGDGSTRNVVKEIEEISRAAFKQMGVNDALNKQLHEGWKGFKEIVDDTLYGAIDDTGTSADFGGNFTFVTDAGSVITVKQPLNTAVVQSEMLKHAIFLADPRQVRRIAAGKLAIFTSKQSVTKGNRFGELRFPVAALESIQNDLWRPLTLMTGGYVFRNMSDSLLRQSFAPNIQTGIFHPLDLIQVAMFKKFKGDILGFSFKGDPEDLIRAGQHELADSAGFSIREMNAPQNVLSREQKTGVWTRYEIGNGIEDFSKAVAAEMSLLHGDEAMRIAAKGEAAPGKTLTETILDWVTNTPQGNKYIRQIQNMWTNRTVIDPATNLPVRGSASFIDKAGKIDVNEVRAYIESVTFGRLAQSTGNDPRLLEVIATGSWTNIEGEAIPALLKHRTGEIKGYSDEFLSEINKIVEDPNIQLTKWYKAQVTVSAQNYQGRFAPIVNGMNKTVDIFFGALYPKRELFLNRSPVFRQQYFNVIDEFLDELAPGQVTEILRSVKQAAKEAKKPYGVKFLEQYVGNAKLAQKMLDKESGKLPSKGNLTREELDAYAKGYALDETKKLFYNAAEKSNFADIMRIIAPFGSAWAEVTKNWAKMLATDPETLKRATKSVQSLTTADPDNDGRGFFYKDPTSGEYVFNYPLSEDLAPLLIAGGAALGFIGGGFGGAIAGGITGATISGPANTGVEGLGVDFVAPAKSLNMGLQLVPGPGPYVQVAANKIIPQKPSTDWIRKLFLPYGAPEIDWVTMPSWFNKAVEAVVADPDNDRIFGDMTLQVMEALAMSGKYDLTTLVGAKELEDDAINKARYLLGLRAAFQFIGPTRPVPQIKVPLSEEKREQTITLDEEKLDLTKIDIHGTELAKYFRQLQEENYDTAVRKFMETFGDDAFLYMAGKTKTTVGGLDASKEFAQWERDNSKFFDTYKEVAGYFAPVGTEFDYQVYTRQIELGLRELLKPDELVSESQRLVGVALYREVVRFAGPKPSKEERQVIADYRKDLYEQYPGFERADINTNKEPANISVLYEAAFDPRMDDNNIAIATREYLNVRDFALEIAAERGDGLGAESNSDLQGILRQEGERLVGQYPEFARLWDRILFSEVDLGR